MLGLSAQDFMRHHCGTVYHMQNRPS